ncbi:hypothetical protein PIB19_21245 [Sphingomonas sp. 7/4-4]|uniref:hypothetical protein n=1 Tax=Sphingomonas sp. 7/4-4 TaxID=3018446 RepID=UPI0022F38606|nr:hypothetical protein [Sphingomonas sp. 7/4-4]WBY07773.1 hypothetical protein PIB19_21245 [Sphingomonas sp. 7/4-4]
MDSPAQSLNAPAPRLASLDLVRGVAVLGILLLNVLSFGLPEAAYVNPRAYGGWHGMDLAAWAINFVLFDGKMRGLFSFLFGASMLLVIERAEANRRAPRRSITAGCSGCSPSGSRISGWSGTATSSPIMR